MSMKVRVLDVYIGEGKIIDCNPSGTIVEIDLPLLKWLRLKILGETPLHKATLQGWTAPQMFYIARCNGCGRYYLTHPHGQYGERLPCQPCYESMLKRMHLI